MTVWTIIKRWSTNDGNNAKDAGNVADAGNKTTEQNCISNCYYFMLHFKEIGAVIVINELMELEWGMCGSAGRSSSSSQLEP